MLRVIKGLRKSSMSITEMDENFKVKVKQLHQFEILIIKKLRTKDPI